MDVDIPQVQLTEYPIEVEVQPTPMPFPPIPEPTEVSEPVSIIPPNSYKDIKDSTYFKENIMAKKKTTRKLSKKEKAELAAGKQPRSPIKPKPL